MIELSNNHRFEYMVASGALGFDGKGYPWEWPLRWMGFLDPSLFTVVIKTLTWEPRKGNLKWTKPWECIKILREDGKIIGIVNAVGLTNPGFEWWCDKIGPKINRKKIPVVISLLGSFEELSEMAYQLRDFDIVALEINASCPNTGDDLFKNTHEIIYGCEIIKKMSHVPLILKLSIANDFKTIIKETCSIIEAYSINSIPWKFIFPGKTSPLEKFGGGGASGKIAQPYTWHLAGEMAKMSRVPVIVPSIWDFGDIEKAIELTGAKAVSFGSVFIRYPWRPTSFVRQLEKRKEKQF